MLIRELLQNSSSDRICDLLYDRYDVGIPERKNQKEFAHRYALGLYDLCERITEAHPDTAYYYPEFDCDPTGSTIINAGIVPFFHNEDFRSRTYTFIAKE